MEHQPPPFFKHGPSLLTRLTFFSLLSVALLVMDARFHALGTIRQSLALALLPLQQAAIAPATLLERAGRFFASQERLTRENLALRQQQLVQAEQLLRFQAVQAENAQLLRLHEKRQALRQPSILAEIVYAGRDPLARKIIVDKGEREGVQPGQVVIDNIGVVGQVTRTYPYSSEVTLLTDKDQAVPVQIVRTGLRAIAFGQGQEAVLDLPFVAANVDVQNGDVLVTSGIDGTYPAGLPVAVVARIERNAGYVFAKISCLPSAGVDRNRQVLILAGPPPGGDALRPGGAAPRRK